MLTRQLRLVGFERCPEDDQRVKCLPCSIAAPSGSYTILRRAVRKHTESEAHRIALDREARRQERRELALAAQRERDLRAAVLTVPSELAQHNTVQHRHVSLTETCLDSTIHLDGTLYGADGNPIVVSAGTLPHDMHRTAVLGELSTIGSAQASGALFGAGVLHEQPAIEGMDWPDSESEDAPGGSAEQHPVLALISSLLENNHLGKAS